MGDAVRRGRAMPTRDGMIAAIARANGGVLATRNFRNFEGTGLQIISPSPREIDDRRRAL